MLTLANIDQKYENAISTSQRKPTYVLIHQDNKRYLEFEAIKENGFEGSWTSLYMYQDMVVIWTKYAPQEDVILLYEN